MGCLREAARLDGPSQAPRHLPVGVRPLRSRQVTTTRSGAADAAAPGPFRGRARTLVDVQFSELPCLSCGGAGSHARVVSTAGAAQGAALLRARPGPFGRRDALFLDGWTTWAEVSVAPRAVESITVEVWFAPRAFPCGDGAGFTALVDATGRATGIALGHDRDGRVAARVSDRTSVFDHRLERDRWQQLTLTIHGGLASVAVDGRVIGEWPVGAGAIPLSDRITLGGLNNGHRLEGLFLQTLAVGLLGPVKIRLDDEPSEHRVPSDPDVRDALPDRARYVADRHRPIAHVSAPQGWMNEPHAPLDIAGEHHLFYQHNPGGPYWGRIAWGHAVSQDLVHWTDAPIAIAPSDGGLAPDGIWSGSSVLGSQGEHLLYVTAGDMSHVPDQSIAVARPRGDRWILDERPVLEMPMTVPGRAEALIPGQFRDPFVWREGGEWFLLVGAGLAGAGGAALLFHSRDGRAWQQEAPLHVGDVAAHPATGVMWELPVLLPLGLGADGRRRHALFVAPWWADESMHHLQHVWHWIGVWDAATRRFTPDTERPREFDGGGHLTGPSGTVTSDGRSILWTIAQDKRSLAEFEESGWAHNAGLPLEIGLHPDGELRVRPVDEIRALRECLLARWDAPSAGPPDLSAVRGNNLELQFEINGTGFVLELLHSRDGTEVTRLGVDRQWAWIDRSRSSLDLSHSEAVRGIHRPDSPHIRARVVIDGSMVEMYIDDRISVTSRAYPTTDDPQCIRLTPAADATLLRFEAYELHAAYRPKGAD
ncbi:GH32 C-terminal domain-containing protein [Microbacterium sp. B2969]|uniref:beta-fructofuranosidase n=1 Tax=Microbacterium alkaliflavum TaxID=3248839 RepID=A0ABW7QE48_9MICO